MPLIYENIVYALKDIGLFDVILPFVLFYTIVFALLQRNAVLGTKNGKPRTRINAMVAFVTAFFGIISLRVINITNYLAVYLGVLIVGGLMFVLVMGLAGITRPEKLPGIKAILFLVFAFTALYAFAMAGFIDMKKLTGYITVPAVIIFVFVIVMYFFFKPEKSSGQAKPPRPRAMPPGLPPMLEEE